MRGYREITLLVWSLPISIGLSKLRGTRCLPCVHRALVLVKAIRANHTSTKHRRLTMILKESRVHESDTTEPPYESRVWSTFDTVSRGGDDSRSSSITSRLGAEAGGASTVVRGAEQPCSIAAAGNARIRGFGVSCVGFRVCLPDRFHRRRRIALAWFLRTGRTPRMRDIALEARRAKTGRTHSMFESVRSADGRGGFPVCGAAAADIY